MPIELKIPDGGESITEVEIGDWLKHKGDRVEKDESLVTLESDKATVDLPSPIAGIITEVLKQKGQTAKVGEVIAYLEKDGSGEKASKEKEPAKPADEKPKPEPAAAAKVVAQRETPAAQRPPAKKESPPKETEPERQGDDSPNGDVSPQDEERKKTPVAREPQSPTERPSAAPPETKEVAPPRATRVTAAADGEEEVVPMSRLRRTVAQRLVEAQNTAALLTTFNEIDMSNVMKLRKEHGEAFQQKYNVKLGVMSFFVKGCVDALKLFPQLNAEVRETDIVYHNYYDIGIAIGGGKGLVVPVLRRAERMSFAEIETTIAELAHRARENKLKVEELQGGTFTITNGGVYGSLLSTPIVNPPQSGILGLHAIQERPVARAGIVVICPMMYVALTYDHRIVDGREAVTFLKRIKEVAENPARMLIEV